MMIEGVVLAEIEWMNLTRILQLVMMVLVFMIYRDLHKLLLKSLVVLWESNHGVHYHRLLVIFWQIIEIIFQVHFLPFEAVGLT